MALIFRSSPFQSAPQSNLRLVGTRGHQLISTEPTARSFMTRQGFFTFETISQIGIVISNFHVTLTTGEQPVGAPITCTASIMFPLNTFTRVTFNGGATSVVVPDGGYAVSDLMTLATPISPSTAAECRVWGLCPAGMGQYDQHATGDVLNWDTTGTLVDNTLTPNFGNVNKNNTSFPLLAFFGPGHLPALALWSDSIGEGFSGQSYSPDGLGNLGPQARGLGASYPYTKFGIQSGALSQVSAPGAATLRTQILQAYCTHSVIQLGVNDIATHTTAQMLGYVQTVAGYFNNKTLAGTITPRTSKVTPTTTTDTPSGNVLTLSSAASILVGQRIYATNIPFGTTVSSFGAGSATLTTNADTLSGSVLPFATTVASGVANGQGVSGTNIPFGTTVASFTTTTVTLSQPVSGDVPNGTTISFGPAVTMSASVTGDVPNGTTIIFAAPAFGATQETQRVNYNDTLRTALPPYLAGYFEVANTVERAQDDGWWNNYSNTPDGTHPNESGAVLEATGWNPSLIN